MKALVLHGDYDIRVEHRPDPVAGPGEVVVAVLATGICGSDFHGYSGENGRRQPGQVMGHETVGHVADAGAGVDGLAVGQLVTVNPMMPCGDCDACSVDYAPACVNRSVIGVTPEISAAFADAMVVPARNVVVLPDGMVPEVGALVEPLAVGWHAVRRGTPTPTDRVVVIGGGPIGQACVLAAQRAGVATVMVTDVDERRRELCARLGAATADPAAADFAAHVRDGLGGPATLVVDAVGVNATMGDAFALSGPGARVVLVGMGSPRLDLAAYDVSTGERSVIGSFCYTDEEFRDTASWVGANATRLRTLIDGRVGWDGAPGSFEALARGTSAASKILVFPGGVPEAADA